MHTHSVHAAVVKNTVCITVLTAAMYPLVREALRTLLETDPELCVVGEAVDGRDAIRLARERQPDILLLDDGMPDLSAADTLRELAQGTPAVRTLLLLAHAHRADVLDALTSGARGVVMSHAASSLLFKSIRTVMAGHYWVGQDCVDDMIDRMRHRGSAPGQPPSHAALGLSARELQVVSTIAAGYTNDDIAKALCISVKTVKRHLTNIFDKVGISNRLELASFAVRHRLVAHSPAAPPPHQT